MKIKRLEIHGFKSFVDKTSLVFPKGVTSIVGPNGCGKSNIVDAIRWVLGEQNARHLRGKLMEDIIFNGSESRKPIGMAEAVLTLSNEEGIAPAAYVNFTEIEIARRLYRSGESEYYINKVQCRLKDVVDLFTDTGIGTRAYSIIEQGQVGWLVNAKPDERRVLFEEAAGINKYKSRKDAALRRLEATRQNLTRVNDIIGEVKRQMNSLNRQAKKAERYKVMREELKGLELYLAFEEYKALKEKKSETEKRLSALKEKELELSTAMLQKQSGLEDVRRRYLEEENDLKAIRQKAFEINSLVQDKEKELQVCDLRIDELKRNEKRLLKEIEELKNQTESVGIEINELNRVSHELTLAVESEGARLLNEENALKDVERRSQESEVRSQGLRKRKDDIGNKAVQIRNNIAGYLKDEERLNLAIGRFLREKEELDSKISDFGLRIAELKNRKEAIEKGKYDIEKTQELTAAQLKELEARIALQENELNGFKEGLTQTSSRLHTLRELEKNMEGFEDGVRAIVLDKKEGSGVKGQGSEIHGLVADVIETSAQYEKAVEAVLGKRLQYVIVESHEEGVEAVEYLKRQAKGRGSFIPLHGARLSEYTAEESSPYPDTTALISHIRVKEGYSPIARYLLGDVFLVKDLNRGIALWKSNGLDKTFVTPDGDMIDRHGVIAGGYSNGKDGGILQKKREIKGLTVVVADLEKVILKTEEEIKTLKHEAEANRRNLDGLKKDSHSKEIELVNIGGELKRDEAEGERIRERLKALNSEIQEAGKELEGIAVKKNQLLKDRESAETELKEMETALQIAADEVSEIYRKKDELSGIVTAIKVQLASSGERLESVKAQMRGKESFLADIGNRIRGKQDEIEGGRAERGEQEGRAAKIKEAVEGSLKIMDSIRKEEVLQEERINQTVTEANRLEEALNGIKKNMAGLQEEANAINLALKDIELNTGRIIERMAERYGAALDDYVPSEEAAALDKEARAARMNELREKITELGEVSLGAIEEYKELETRHQFLLDQQTDLNSSVETLHKAINRINRTTRQRFKETFDAINLKFQEVFPEFFQGGKAELRLVDEGDLLESGIEIVAQPPGKRLQSISLLSGGEKALTATSLIFSIFLIKPSPFCLLDEVDAPLDDANIDRFNGFLKEMAKKSQFILITHNKRTMEIADTLFGVTMEEAGVSKIVSVRLN
ncbi:MAG: chromosome segregation protein SMC [Deltaproteobacteria bacterium]|nr:chromosome segregation protein SMC [Deltaproteobacteria bacterium]